MWPLLKLLTYLTLKFWWMATANWVLKCTYIVPIEASFNFLKRFSLNLVRACTHTRTHTHVYTHTNTFTHSHTHVYTHTHTHSHKHRNSLLTITHTHTHPITLTLFISLYHIHTHTHTHTYTHSHAHTYRVAYRSTSKFNYNETVIRRQCNVAFKCDSFILFWLFVLRPTIRH